LCLADLLGDVTDIDKTFGIELCPVAGRHHDVGPGLGLDRRGDPRLHAVAIDGLDRERYAERLLALFLQLALE